MQQSNIVRKKLSLGEISDKGHKDTFNIDDFERFLLYEKCYSPYNTYQFVSLAKRIRKVYGLSGPYCIEDGYRIREDLESKGITNATIRNYLRTLEVLAEYEGMPLSLKKPKTVHKIPPTLRSMGVKALIDACQNIRDLALIHVLCYGALRRGEVSRLNINDVDGCIIHVRGATKTRRERNVVLTSEAVKALNKWMKVRPETPGNNALFITSFGDRLSGLQIYRIVKTTAKIAGIDNITVHGLRHTAASTMLRSGMSAVEVAQMLGHQSISTTLNVYCHGSLEDLEKAVNSKFKY